MRTLSIGAHLVAAIHQAARRAHPLECCGLVEGIVTNDGWQASAVHETPNLSGEPERAFLIDPAAQFHLLRGLRGTGRGIIGCFHSHPEGTAQPSERDRREAVENDFVWLVAATDGAGETLGSYVFNSAGAHFDPITLRQTA